MRQARLPITLDNGREPMPLARYLRWIAPTCTDPQLVDRLTALARHFEETRAAVGDPACPQLRTPA